MTYTPVSIRDALRCGVALVDDLHTTTFIVPHVTDRSIYA